MLLLFSLTLSARVSSTCEPGGFEKVSTPLPSEKGGTPAEQIGANSVELTSLELVALSQRRSEARGVLAIANPFSFPIAVSVGGGRLRIGAEEVGGGSARRRVIPARKRKAVEILFAVNRDRFLAAAGNGWSVGAPVDSQVEVSLTFRLPKGEQSLPVRFTRAMGTDGARSGVFAWPEGGALLSPR